MTAEPDEPEKPQNEDDWIESLDRYGVDKIVLQTAPFGSSDKVSDFIAKCKHPERFIPLANIDMLDPEGSNSAQELERCVKELGLKGVGELYPNIGPWDPGDEKCFPVRPVIDAKLLPVAKNPASAQGVLEREHTRKFVGRGDVFDSQPEIGHTDEVAEINEPVAFVT